MRTIAASTMFMLLLCPPAAAQADGPLRAGTRVRVMTTTFPDRWIAGTLGRVTSQSVLIDQHAFLPASIGQVEVSDGRTSRFFPGLATGAAIGAAVGLVSYQLATGLDDSGATYNQWIHVGVGVAAGMVIGGIVGALSGTERWRAVSADQIRVAVFPAQRDGVGLQISATF